jgi:hypothetical protein
VALSSTISLVALNFFGLACDEFRGRVNIAIVAMPRITNAMSNLTGARLPLVFLVFLKWFSGLDFMVAPYFE